MLNLRRPPQIATVFVGSFMYRAIGTGPADNPRDGMNLNAVKLGLLAITAQIKKKQSIP